MNKEFSVNILTSRPYVLNCNFNFNQKRDLSLEKQLSELLTLYQSIQSMSTVQYMLITYTSIVHMTQAGFPVQNLSIWLI